jgi:hypothetical protein
VSTAERQAIQNFGTRLQRILKRCEESETCTCGLASGHLSTCPRQAWKTAITMVQMEMEDETGESLKNVHQNQ